MFLATLGLACYLLMFVHPLFYVPATILLLAGILSPTPRY